MDIIPQEMRDHMDIAERIQWIQCEHKLAEEFDRALRQGTWNRILGAIIVVVLILVMTVLVLTPAKAANPVIEEYVPLSRGLLPIELVGVDATPYQLEKAREQLVQTKEWRLVKAGDQKNYPGKCFITLKRGEVVVECAVGTYSDAPWVLLERPRRTLVPRSFKSVSDALATIRNFSRHSLKDYPIPQFQQPRMENTI